MSAPKAGYKGAVYIEGTKIGGGTTWSYSGSTRNMQPIDEFGDEIITHIPLQIEGGDISVTGNYLMNSDAGQQAVRVLFKSGDQITDLKLYVSYADTIYEWPDNSTSPASYVTVTNYDNIADDKSGIGSFTMTFKVSGILVPVGT